LPSASLQHVTAQLKFGP